MKKPILIIALFAAAAAGNIHPPRAAAREGLGLKTGYIQPTGRLNESFGSGFLLALHFTETLGWLFGLDFTLGSMYLGETSRRDISQNIFLSPSYDVKMNVTYLGIAPFINIEFPSGLSADFSAGAGLYGVMVLVDAGLFSAEDTQYHVGLNIGAGIYYKLASSFKIGMDLAAYQLWTSDDADDWVRIYTEGDKNPRFYQISLGALLYLN